MFSTNAARITEYPYAGNKWTSTNSSHCIPKKKKKKRLAKWIIHRPIGTTQGYKTSRRKHRKKSNFWLDRNFLDTVSITLPVKESNDKYWQNIRHLFKLFSEKGTFRRIKQAANWEKVFAEHLSDKDIFLYITRICQNSKMRKQRIHSKIYKNVNRHFTEENIWIVP